MPCDPNEVITPEDMEGFVDNINLINDVVESSESTLTTPQGSEIYTLRGQLARLGYLPPEVYAAAIDFTINDAAKTIDRNGIVYAPLPSELPFTTSGTWTADDEDKFFVIQTTGATASMNDRVGELIGKMAAGDVVTVGCFGDSTTDGNATSGWSGNPVGGGGNAIGTTDHNIAAPNAWPAQTLIMLQDMHNNANIEVWNAGYQGRSMYDGWANANYTAAMINNPEYGTPDLLFTDWGINDSQNPGDIIGDFMDEYRTFLTTVIAQGTVPIIVTCDPVIQNGSFGPNTVDQKVVRRQLDAAKRTLACEFGIPLFDRGAIVLDWIQDNTDNYRFITEQSDFLHFKDAGHSFKAQATAAYLFNDLVNFAGGSARMNSITSQSSFESADPLSIFTFTNNEQGGNNLFNLNSPTNTDVLTYWLWNTCPNTHLHYLGIDNENVAPSITTPPSVRVTSQFDPAVAEVYDIKSAKINAPGIGFSDDPHYFGKLKYGLNKIVYRTGSGTSAYYTGFRLDESAKTLGGNCIEHIGTPARTWIPAAGVPGDKTVQPFPLNSNLSNFIPGVLKDSSYIIEFKIKLVQESGVILCHGQGWDGAQTGVDNNKQTAIILYRTGSDTLAIWSARYNGTDLAFDAFTVAANSAALPWTSGEFEGRIEIGKDTGLNEQTIDVYDDPVDPGASSVISVSTANAGVRWGGIAGGFLASSGDVGYTEGELRIDYMRIRR